MGELNTDYVTWPLGFYADKAYFFVVANIYVMPNPRLKSTIATEMYVVEVGLVSPVEWKPETPSERFDPLAREEKIQNCFTRHWTK